MGHGIDWPGKNRSLLPPPGVSESQCHTLHVFNNGTCSVSCWELTDEEWEEVLRTRRIYASVWYGSSQPPMLIGSESVVREVVADYGAVWKKEPG